MKEWNKYWLDEEVRRCSFCDKDILETLYRRLQEIKEWFNILGERKENVLERIWSEDLDERKRDFSKNGRQKRRQKGRKKKRNLEERMVEERNGEREKRISCDM